MYRLLLVCLLAPAFAASSWSTPSVVATSRDLAPEVQKSIAEGRALLKAGKAQEALALFEKADTASQNDPDAHIWVLRAWIELGRLNDALNEADRMTKAKIDTAGLDYIYGIGSFQRARNVMQAGGNPGLAFGDAVTYLQSALDRDPLTYADAWIVLAHASWYLPELDRALAAIDKAVEYDPQSAMVRSIEGEVHFSAYKDAVMNAKEGEEVPKDHAQTALAAFARAAELTPKDPAHGADQFAIWRQLGYVHAWLKDMPKASESFAEAIAWAPEPGDYFPMWQSLAPEGDLTLYNTTLERGLEGYRKRFGKEGSGAATILWWLGYGQMTAKKYEQAEASFHEAVERNKGYANSWFYIGLTRYYRQDYAGACESWLTYWDLDPQGLVNTILADETNMLPIVEFAVAKVTEAGYGGRGSLESLRTAERMNQVLAATKPSNATYANNLGLLRRDIGEIAWNQNPEESEARATMAMFESSLKAYEQALALAPDDPGFLNDAAVVLQYYLGRDLDKAREYYQRAQTQAGEWIARESWKSLPENQQANEESRIRTALKDSGDNLAKLEKGEVGNRGPLGKEKRKGKGKKQVDANAPK
ncbi:MAG: tetratricopeptide repeat protein [Planctomycetes bacterium]|nr:tetratricopeptide repeat protein [Planctomycetota bacterium]HPF13273.1 tetratricopeptide repeat protein [Planctomycetota bacterium]